MLDCGQRTGELVWRLPLHPRYAEQTKGRYAVLTNRPEPRVGLASAAAEFLHHFAGDVPWAHLDMLAVAYNGRTPYLDQGGTGWGVRLLAELALEFGRVSGGGPAAAAPLLTAALAAAWRGAPSGAGSPGDPATVSPRRARLQGTFTVTGVVTQAVNVPGERRGEHVTRTWTFVRRARPAPARRCSCLRQRGRAATTRSAAPPAAGLLHRRTGLHRPGALPRPRLPQGERVPFTITLHITAAAARSPRHGRHRLHRHLPQPQARRPHPLLQRAEL